MPDNVELTVGGRRLDKFISYRCDADLYQAGDDFSVTLGNPGFDLAEGARCELRVNGVLALTGLVDKIEDGGGKGGNQVRLDGRDLMGLLVDSYVENFVTLENVTLKGLATSLLATVPYINRKAIVYQAGIAGKKAQATAAANSLLDSPQAKAQIEPGVTIFEVLKDQAVSRGGMFFMLPDGTFVFGRPKAAGQPAFQLVRRRDGRGNNVISGRRIRDLSQRWSKITVVGQQQGADTLSAEEINTKATVLDPQVPYYRPKVVVNNNDDKSPAKQVRFLLEQQRAQGLSFVYQVARHTQNDQVWAINELCLVEDEVLGVKGTYLISGRTLELDKKQGPVTEVRLSLPGVIA